MSEHYIEFDNVRKSYGSGDAQINALSDASFHVNKGEFCVLLGSFLGTLPGMIVSTLLGMNITDPSSMFWVSIGLTVGISVISFLVYFIWKIAKKKKTSV